MERPFTLDHLDHVVLRVRDLEKSVAFYRMLGGDIAGPRPAGTAVRITDGQTVILQKRTDYDPANVSAIDHINLAIRASGIDEVVAYLKENGAPIAREPQAQEGRVPDTVRVADPDGHIVEIRLVRDR